MLRLSQDVIWIAHTISKVSVVIVVHGLYSKHGVKKKHTNSKNRGVISYPGKKYKESRIPALTIGIQNPSPLTKSIGETYLACLASVSVRFRSKERGKRVNDRATNEAFISRSVKTENPLPRSFFAPKPNGNACYAG